MGVFPDIEDLDIIEKVIETVGVAIAVYDADGEFLYVNSAYAAMLDTEQQALIGATVWDVNPEFDADRFEGYWQSFDEGQSRYAEAVHQWEGMRVPVTTVTTRTTVGEAAYHVGTVQDISERKERERQLEELHVVTRHLMAASSRNEIATITARTAETLLGYEQSIVRLLEDGDLVPVAVSEAAQAELGDRPVYPVEGDTPAARAFRRDEPLTIEDSTTIEDEYDRGSAQSFTYVPLGDHGVLSVAAPCEDAFDRADIYIASILGSNTATALNRLADERDLERQNERFEAFYDVISHDIPNHLNVAQTRLQLAEADGDLGQLSHVSNAHQRIETVIDDMRTLVRQGEHVDETAPLALSSVARACWDGSQTGDGDASLDVGADATVHASQSRLKQLLENLFWNALEHGGPDVTVRVGVSDGTLFVADDGPGIPAGEREEVLSPGYTTANGHSGFGLAIAREIARAHGWSMTVTESESGGARFEFAGIRTEDG